MINKIWTKKWKNYSAFVGDVKVDHVEVKKINLFVGRNNSGKSFFVRELLKSADVDLFYSTPNDSFNEFQIELNELSKHIPRNAKVNGIEGARIEYLKNISACFSVNDRNEIQKIISEIKRIREAGIHLSAGSINHNIRGLLESYFNNNKRDILSGHIEKHLELKYRYIPMLRGMRPFSEKKGEYLNRTISDYFSGAQSKNCTIHTGEDLYDLFKMYLLGLPDQRQRIYEYEKLLADMFFEGNKVTLIPKHDHDVVNIKIGNDSQRPIFEVGDGLQQIIILTSTAFLAEEKLLVVVEEPENCMHPGLLRQLMFFLLNNTPHQYFITTHSNHILEIADESDEVLRHKVSKIEYGETPKFQILSLKREREILADLGVRGSSIYIANCTIWIEGITDRIYLRAFIKKYLEKLKEKDVSKFGRYIKFKENYHFSYIEYQGGNLTHWTFSEDDTTLDELNAVSISSPAFLIADGDIRNKGDRAKKMREQLGERFYIIMGKEIENLIPDEIVKSTSKKLFREFKRNKFNKNIDEIEKLKYKHYVDSPDGIGFHIDKVLGLKGKGKAGTHQIFATSSGSLRDKVLFCNTAVSLMDEIDWEISENIFSLCEMIFKHIEKYNRL